MSLQQLYLAFLIGGLVLLASIVGTRVASRVGFPSLLLYLLIGVAVGEDGLGLQFNDVELARNIGTAALAVILVEGGLTTRFSDIRKVLAPAGALATIGMVISTVITAVGAHLLLHGCEVGVEIDKEPIHASAGRLRWDRQRRWLRNLEFLRPFLVQKGRFRGDRFRKGGLRIWAGEHRLFIFAFYSLYCK